MIPRTAPLLLSLALAGCAGTAPWRNDQALAARKLEVLVDRKGRVVEVEYHVDPSEVPDAVRDAMERLHPGGRTTGAERELAGEELGYELAKEIDGRAVEALFLADGTLVAEEVEVVAASVPGAVRAAVAKRTPGPVAKWEEVRDGERELVEYHAKTTSDGVRLKLRVSPRGKLLGVVREVDAEIEVPAE